ncbi:hypothetical protein BDY21DRAFT_347557 [Lineolata rhizophorae]|uniref:Uncharacterized protein n=1 Tax=Lineolata rhizophorae TaxID=578093 RepID=A0A6A6NYE4_9PEZI|nr:hypothetical protein BDY21DRAFT_347557 [Lineolata rhizophorae]
MRQWGDVDRSKGEGGGVARKMVFGKLAGVRPGVVVVQRSNEIVAELRFREDLTREDAEYLEKELVEDDMVLLRREELKF